MQNKLYWEKEDIIRSIRRGFSEDRFESSDRVKCWVYSVTSIGKDWEFIAP